MVKKRKVASVHTAAAKGSEGVTGPRCAGRLTLDQSLWPQKCNTRDRVAWTAQSAGKSGYGQGAKGPWVFTFLIDFILCFDM